MKDYDNYLNVWEGHTVVQLEGTVYRKELRQVRETGRIGEVPWEREVPVDCFWDLGRANHTCIWFGQFVAMQFRVVDFLDGQGEDITYYLKELQNRPYIYGTMFLPHDAKHKKLVYKHSIEKIVRDKYPDTRLVPKTTLQDGINMARLFFPKCHFDALACADGLGALSRYKYKVVDGQITGDPVHDDGGDCDAADAFRYMAQAARPPPPGLARASPTAGSGPTGPASFGLWRGTRTKNTRAEARWLRPGLDGIGVMAADPDPGTLTLSGDPIVEEATKRFKRCVEWESSARENFLNDYKFRHGDSYNGYQWPNRTRNNRELDARPCLTMNITRQHNLQITNEALQNKSSVAFRATGGSATKASANLYEAMFRRVEYLSNAQSAYKTACSYQVDGGIGWIRLVTEL